MTLLKEDHLANHITSLIHRDTQQQKNRMDLTAGKVHKFTGPGSLDFGGSEFEPADRQLIRPEKKNEDDDYGWWNLPEGSYRVTMNEKIDAAHPNTVIGILAPHDHARQAGLISGSILLSAEEGQQSISLNVHVPEGGCNIKENARVAALYLVEL